ncbi:MAG: hypothetical protein HYS18_07770 [Burkholderiales bacterium]|nr:hypothetical protein [Burkholderiales bacterium]
MQKTLLAKASFAAFVIGIAAVLPSHAQGMFKCGNSYQDRPCDGKDSGKELKVRNTIAAEGGANPVNDAQCATRGARAQKMVWAREGGATQEKMLGEARSADERELVMEVYARRGTSHEVRAAIEATCVAEKERMAKAAALLESAGLKKQEMPQASANTQQRDAGASNNTMAQSSSAEDKKKRTCDNLRKQRSDTVSSQRSGGSGSRQDAWNQQIRELDNKLRENQCP